MAGTLIFFPLVQQVQLRSLEDLGKACNLHGKGGALLKVEVVDGIEGFQQCNLGLIFVGEYDTPQVPGGKLI